MTAPISSPADGHAQAIAHVIQLLPRVAGIAGREQLVRRTIAKYPHLDPVAEARRCIVYRTRHPVERSDWATTYACWMRAEDMVAREVRGVA